MVYLWPLRAAISASKKQNWGDAGLYFNQQMFVTQQTVMYATLHTIFNIDKI